MQEVEEIVEEVVEATETEEATEGTDNPPVEGEAEGVESDAEKKQAREKFWERQNKTKEQAADAERLRRENEYLRQQALQSQQAPHAPQQQYVDPNEPDLDTYLENGRTAQNWSRDHHKYLRDQEHVAQSRNNVAQTYNERLKEASKESKDIYAYEDAVTRIIGDRAYIATEIVESESAPAIIEAIALKPELADGLLNARDQRSLTREMIKLENSIKKKPSFSGAPTPKSQSKGEPPQSSSVDLSSVSFSEYRRLRNQQRK